MSVGACETVGGRAAVEPFGGWHSLQIALAVLLVACASSEGLEVAAGDAGSGQSGSSGSGDDSSAGRAGSAGSSDGSSESSSGGSIDSASGGSSTGGGTQDGAADVANGGTSGADAAGGSAGASGCGSGSVQLGAKCATFGGVYATQGPGCAAACRVQNPYASGCACPAGFTPIGPIDMLDDSGCTANNPPFGWTSAFVCAGGSFSASSDFGGAYQREGASCKQGNPFAAGACDCPAGTVKIESVVDGACWNDTHFGLCWNSTAPLSTFGGAYQKSDSTSYGNAGCVVGNPASGGACSCPAGTTEIQVRMVYGPGNASCKANGAFGGHIYVCRAP